MNSDKIFTTPALKSLFSHLKPSSKYLMCNMHSGKNLLNNLFAEMKRQGYLQPSDLSYVELVDRVPEDTFNQILSKCKRSY